MRLNVTALGSPTGRAAAKAVGDIVKYLIGWSKDRDAPGAEPGQQAGTGTDAIGGPERRDGQGDPSRYYADSGDEPGRWRGRGAVEMGLSGTVEPADFASVLGGRHPATGERLITARGSAGRVAEVGAGTAARWAPDGEALYGIADVAAVLGAGWTQGDVLDAVDKGMELAASRIFALLAGTGTDDSDPGMALVPVVARDGTMLIRESELARLEALTVASRDEEGVLATGQPDDVLSAKEAARLIGTSVRYIRELCHTWEKDRARIEAAIATDGSSGTAHLVAERGERGAWRIRREDLGAYAGRRRQPAVRVGYDVTGTTEKSLSVLALLGGSDVRTAVLAAIEAGNDTGMDWLEQNAACARDGDGVTGVTGWTVASFRHLTSRRLDPFVHHHNVIANTVTDEHGVRRALDARRLYARVSAGSAVATAQMRFELVSKLGIAFRPARHGGWEIAGIDEALVDEFSTRSREVNETVRELEEALGRSTTLDEFRTVVANTRPAKRAVPGESAALEEWWARARGHGLTPEALDRCRGRRAPTVLTPRRRAAILAALERAVTVESSVFDRTDVLAALVDLPEPGAADLGPIVVPANVLEDLADEFLTSDLVVPLTASSGRRDHLVRKDGITIDVGGTTVQEFSTVKMLLLQARTIDNYRAGFGAGAGIVPPAVLEKAIAEGELTGEQEALVEMFCTSGDIAQSGVGRAGTGKTYAMRAAVAAWEAAGYRVMGTAVKSEAARHLGDRCGITAEPLAWYLNRLDDPLRSPLDGRTVLIVDEASTVADRDLDRLLWAAQRDGAVLRLIGDPAQHSSVAAGGVWHVITDKFADRTPVLESGQRVRHLEDRAAAKALREGDARTALAALEYAGHLHIVESERDLYAQLLDRWWTSRHAGAGHPMVDRRNDQRLVLNRLAQTLRRQLGELGEIEIVASGGRRYAVGDEVVARMGDRELHPAGRPDAYVRNGSAGVVTEVQPGVRPDDDRLVVDFEGLGSIAIPRSFFDEHTDVWGRTDVGIDHAYAVTSYAVEGMTFRESDSHIDPHSTRPEVYVDITRGEEANHVWVTRADDPLDGERLPAVPGPPVEHQLAERLSGPPGELVAIELDPAAVERARALQRRAASAAGDTPGPGTRGLRVALGAATQPDAIIVDRLGGVPPEVYLARRFRQLLAEAALFRDQWQTRPGHTGPWVWALGAPADDPGGRADREALTARFCEYVVDVARCRIGCDLDDASVAIIERLAAEGAFGRLDFQRVVTEVTAGRPLVDAVIAGAVAGITREQEPVSVA